MAFVSFVIGAVVIYFVIKLLSGGGLALTPYDRLLRNGIHARGILLQVANKGTRAGTRTRPFEQRQVYIDVEIPGQAPYETSAFPIIPLNLVRDILPGASVELRISQSNRSTMAIIGPGIGIAQSAVRTAS